MGELPEPLRVRGDSSPIKLAVTPFSDEQLGHALNVVLPLPEDGEKPPRLLKARGTVVELFHCGTDIEGDIQGTAWAALQAVSEYADHHRSTRTVEGTSMEARRLESIWMSKAASMKRQALLAVSGMTQLRLAA